MIEAHQPTIFGGTIIAAVSSVDDGNMRFNRGDDEQTLKNRLAFLEEVGIQPKQATLVQVTYENADNFARYKIVTDDHKSVGILEPKSDIVADALVTQNTGHALFLLVADCVGVIIHDEQKGALMVSHIGRHSAEIEGAKKSVEYLKKTFQSHPNDLKVWLSPAVGKSSYPLHAMGGRGLHEAIQEQLLHAGVPKENIEASAVDTAMNDDYFSHSQYKQGARELDGRFAIVAMMRMQGEPAV